MSSDREQESTPMIDGFIMISGHLPNIEYLVRKFDNERKARH
jgi:hypothetical protein